jgi:peptidyl-dipeptidase Dcp
MTYEVTDDKSLVAVFCRFLSSKGKRNGAWMTSFKGQYIKDEQ